MSDYYLADKRAAERAREREHLDKATTPQAQNIKVTLLGDFLFPSSEPQGCDPYNSTQGKAAVDAWRLRRGRR